MEEEWGFVRQGKSEWQKKENFTLSHIYGRQGELQAMTLENGKNKLSVASWTLKKDEKMKLFFFLFDELKVPTR